MKEKAFSRKGIVDEEFDKGIALKKGSNMQQTVFATYDGNVLKLEKQAGLKKNKRYLIKIESDLRKSEINEFTSDPAYDLSALAVKTGISDLALEHDHYLYGLPKRRKSHASKLLR
jgi:hypothetical protein